jgi:hypothetical protein
MIAALCKQESETSVEEYLAGDSSSGLQRQSLIRALMKLASAQASLTEQEKLILESDPSTALYGPIDRSFQRELIADLIESIRSVGPQGNLDDAIVSTMREYRRAGYDLEQARELLLELGRIAQVPSTFMLLLLDRLKRGD